MSKLDQVLSAHRMSERVLAANAEAEGRMVTIDLDALVKALREVKQKVFNEMVEGNGRQPAEVVDSVVYAMTDSILPNTPVLYHQVLNFYPDYEV